MDCTAPARARQPHSARQATARVSSAAPTRVEVVPPCPGLSEVVRSCPKDFATGRILGTILGTFKPLVAWPLPLPGGGGRPTPGSTEKNRRGRVRKSVAGKETPPSVLGTP